MIRPGSRSGQAMVFGALTLFCLVSFAAAAFDVGQVSSRRIQVQNAADQAALAGAQVEADLLSEIGWINDGMGYIYYNLMRYAVDVNVFGVLAELKQHGPPYPSDALVGVSDPVGQYDLAYDRAQEWMERGQDWIDHLEKLEDGISIAAPGLIREEIFRVAMAMGAEKVAIFPDLVFYPERENYLLLTIERLSNGWRLSDSNGWSVDIQVLGPDSWQVVSSTSGGFTVTRDAPDRYTIQTDGGDTYTLQQAGAGWIVSGPGGTFSVAQGPNGGILVTSGGSSVEYQVGPDGTYQVWQGGQWVPLAQGETLTIDGVEVPISQGTINVGGAQIDLSPFGIHVDNLTITPQGNDVVISGQIGVANLSVQNGTATVNGLTTQNADGVWHLLGGNDKIRHRMTELAADALWNYEYVKDGSVLMPEPNRERFGIRIAVEESDPQFLAGGGYPVWMFHATSNPAGWFDPRSGRTVSGTAYSQTRQCWNCGGAGSGNPLFPCPTCGDTDNDGDGFTDVRKYPQDIPVTPGVPSYLNAELPIPYVLSKTFFRYGINVGVWKDKTKNLLSLPDPDWGAFAFASARAGFRNPSTGLFTYGFTDLAVRDDWIQEDDANLYQPEFEARLVSTRTTIRTDDLDMDPGTDTGANFLLRGFLQTRWLESADDRNPAWAVNGKLSSMLSKDGQRFDPLDPVFDSVLRH